MRRITRRTTPALAAAGLLAGGLLAVTAAAPAGADSSGGDVVWGTVVSRSDLNLRSGPSTSASVVYRLAPGSQDRIECAANGSSVNGTSTWYWFTGARGWASAAYVDTGGHGVPSCTTDGPRSDHDRDHGPSGWWYRETETREFGVWY
ncbi:MULTISPECIES: SH3 domain-containing protein [unclassified Streptomyces]|uniref:SH3 domain-containing protein n=1 Tax=unclassified Streptomyces TaxID=2593676 RepID=UPI00278BFF36|nr:MULTISPECIES: SH3 domain-containing protein [unclassified Streptomyces]